jgi:peptidyl-prolyl cis-trans isomerase C
MARCVPYSSLAGALLAPVLLVCAACTGPSAEQKASGAGDTRQVQAPAGRIAATVNGEPVYAEDVETEAAANGYVSPGTPYDPANPEFRRVLDQLIDQKLMAQEAKGRGLDATQAGARRLAMARERILGNLLLEDIVAREVTPERIEATYAEQVGLRQAGHRVRLSQILVATEEEADALYAQLAGGASFSALAQTHSRDPASRAQGGDMGNVIANDMPPPFPVMIADTATGDVSRPFRTEAGWHLIKVRDRSAEAPPARAEIEPEVVRLLTLNELARLVRSLRSQADISLVTSASPRDSHPDHAPSAGGDEL